MEAEDSSISIGGTHIVAAIVAAYVANNRVAVAELPKLIANIHTAIERLSNKGTSVEPAPEPAKLTQAQIRKSVTHDALISFIDGKEYKTLKRHLTRHELTPNTYRARFGLPADYPMVAPSYSERRSALALSLGLGRKLDKSDTSN